MWKSLALITNDAEERVDPFPTRFSFTEAPVAAEVILSERPESKEVSAAERACLDGKEDLRSTPIISDSTATKTRNETERERRRNFLTKKRVPN